MSQTTDSTTPLSEKFPSKWPLISLFVGWGVGTSGVVSGIHSGFLPVSHRIEVSELVVGAIIYGLFVGLVAALVAQAAIREQAVPWVVISCMSLGLLAGAIVGYAIVQEFFGAVWAGLGGAMLGGLITNKLRNRRTRRCI